MREFRDNTTVIGNIKFFKYIRKFKLHLIFIIYFNFIKTPTKYALHLLHRHTYSYIGNIDFINENMKIPILKDIVCFYLKSMSSSIIF